MVVPATSPILPRGYRPGQPSGSIRNYQKTVDCSEQLHTRSLPDGIPHEVTIRKRNGRWYASIAYWKPPVALPQRETQSVGGVDVGISPLAVDSYSVHYENPKALDSALRKLRRWQRARERRTPGKPRLVGSPASSRRRPAARDRSQEQRPPQGEPGTRPEVPHARHRDVERRRNDQSRPASQGIGRRRYVQPTQPGSATRPSGTAPASLRLTSGIPAARPAPPAAW